MGLMMVVGVFLGGGVGCLARAVLLHFLGTSALGFSVGVVFVNVLGSGWIGYIAGSGSNVASDWRMAALTIGMLGGLTTFSAYSVDVVKWFQSGHLFHALAFVILNNVLSLLACYSFWQWSRLNAA